MYLLILLIAGIWGGWCYYDSRPTPLRGQVDTIGATPLVTDYVPRGTLGRPGVERKIRYIVIHETGNTGKNADAESHNTFLHRECRRQTTSWHYTVDDHEIYSHIPDNELAFHAGDGQSENSGNLGGIGIEMCVNPGNEYEKTVENTAKLTAMLITAYDLDMDKVRMHQDFSGKRCPERMIEEGQWPEFLQRVRQELEEQ